MYSLTIKEKDPKIIEEMIGKVDKDVMTKLFNVIVRSCDVGRGLSDDAIDVYLHKWAESKYEYYLLFGNSLTLNREIDIPEKEDVIRKKTDTILNQDVVYRNKGKEGKVAVNTEHFKIYKLFIDNFSTNDILKNICPNNDLIEKYCPTYKPGMKLSKFLSSYFCDPEFDIEYSKILQTKRNKGIITISIDPNDFLTMSVSSHKWYSCYEITSFYKTCTLSCILDSTSLIAYRSYGNHSYNLSGVEFVWNDKQCRNNIQFDKETLQFSIFSGQGQCGNVIIEEWGNMILERINKYFGKKVEFTRKRAAYYDKTEHHHLHDDNSNDAYIQKGCAVKKCPIGEGVIALNNPKEYISTMEHKNPFV